MTRWLRWSPYSCSSSPLLGLAGRPSEHELVERARDEFRIEEVAERVLRLTRSRTRA